MDYDLGCFPRHAIVSNICQLVAYYPHVYIFYSVLLIEEFRNVVWSLSLTDETRGNDLVAGTYKILTGCVPKNVY